MTLIIVILLSGKQLYKALYMCGSMSIVLHMLSIGHSRYQGEKATRVNHKLLSWTTTFGPLLLYICFCFFIDICGAWLVAIIDQEGMLFTGSTNMVPLSMCRLYMLIINHLLSRDGYSICNIHAYGYQCNSALKQPIRHYQKHVRCTHASVVNNMALNISLSVVVYSPKDRCWVCRPMVIVYCNLQTGEKINCLYACL